jgi:hypothetical protein
MASAYRFGVDTMSTPLEVLLHRGLEYSLGLNTYDRNHSLLLLGGVIGDILIAAHRASSAIGVY